MLPDWRWTAAAGLLVLALVLSLPAGKAMSAAARPPLADEPEAARAAVCSALVPALDPARTATLAEAGITITALEPLGAEVVGMDLRAPQDEAVLALLQVRQPPRAASQRAAPCVHNIEVLRPTRVRPAGDGPPGFPGVQRAGRPVAGRADPSERAVGRPGDPLDARRAPGNARRQ